MAVAVIEARALRKVYGRRQAVAGISFTVAPGECLGVLGPNGAGKTTTIRMILALAPPTSGALSVLGMPMTAANASRIKARLGVVQQEDSLDPDLTVEKNLIVYASYFGISRAVARRRADELIRFAELDDHRTSPIRVLSGGMRRRLMLARALLNDPELLVLDEPTTGLDPQARRLVWERIRTRKAAGTTILLTTHYMEEAAQLCDRLLVMDAGRIVAEGTPRALVEQYVGSEVVEVWLPDDSAAADALAARLGNGSWRTERAGRVLYLYLRDGQARPLLTSLDGLEVTRRRATLEDVFLHLTGHALRD